MTLDEHIDPEGALLDFERALGDIGYVVEAAWEALGRLPRLRDDDGEEDTP